MGRKKIIRTEEEEKKHKIQQKEKRKAYDRQRKLNRKLSQNIPSFISSQNFSLNSSVELSDNQLPSTSRNFEIMQTDENTNESDFETSLLVSKNDIVGDKNVSMDVINNITGQNEQIIRKKHLSFDI